MPCLVKEGSASGSMTGCKDDLYLTTTKVDYLPIIEIPDLSLIVAHIIRNDSHVTGIQINLRESPYSTHMVTMGMGQHHRDRLGSNLCHDLVQIRYVCSCVNQECSVITLNEVERFIINQMSVAYPCMLVNLAEYHMIILINHFATKVTTVNLCTLCPSRIRHQAKQHGCQKNKSFHISILHHSPDKMCFRQFFLYLR